MSGWLLVMWIGGLLIFTLAALWLARRYLENHHNGHGPP